ncbi:MAG: hypothetical protein LBH14_01655 [Desulfobulbaceae bacterium]|jgi:hypothetical protein|nr:hypothetical protein [Desulfobulbaceae bacterium]
MDHKKTLLLCIVLFPLVLFGCATPTTTYTKPAEPTVKEYQADLIVGKTTKADIARMLGTPRSMTDGGGVAGMVQFDMIWQYNFGYIPSSGKEATRAKIRLVQADGTEMFYVLEAKPNPAMRGLLMGGGSVQISINSKGILSSVSITDY